MKRKLAVLLLLCLLFTSLPCSLVTAEEDDDSEIACAESVTDFHFADFDAYNCPAAQNGLENDFIIVKGIISDYIEEQGCVWMIVDEDATRRWMIAIGYDGELGVIDYSDITDRKGAQVTVFLVYYGYSEEYEMPCGSIVECGGVMFEETDSFVTSSIAELMMILNGLNKHDFIDYYHNELSGDNMDSNAENNVTPEPLQNMISDVDEFFEVATPSELLNLRDMINVKIKTCEEWEEVIVPNGTYQVGVDIPAGLWSISAGEENVQCSMMIGDTLEDNKKSIDYFASKQWYDFALCNSWLYGDVPLIHSTVEIMDFPEDFYVEVSKGSVKFATYSGKQDFLFFAEKLPTLDIFNVLVLDNLTYQDLISIKDRLNLAIWNSYRWDRVVVPAGVYRVGKDIPVGNWKIEAPDTSYINISYGSALNDIHLNMELSYLAWDISLYNETYKRYKKGDITSTDIDAEEGFFVGIKMGVYACFTPVTEKKGLGFKQIDEGENKTTVVNDDCELQLFKLNEHSDN